MPSLGSTLHIAMNGLRAQQMALEVTAHNIANASTEGYTRQRAAVSPESPVHLAQGIFGRGAGVTNVERLRDDLLDGTYRRERSTASGFEERSGILGRVEQLFGEPSELGLGAALDQFYSAWSELGSHPTDPGVRSYVRQAASTLTGTLRNLAAGLDAARQEVEAGVRSEVAQVNALTTRIAELNAQIVAHEADGHTAGDLRDLRDRALDDLAALIPVQTFERENGALGVSTSGIAILDGPHAVELEVRTGGGSVTVGVVGRATSLSLESGSIGGMVQVLTEDIPALREGLDDLAAALVEGINAVHRTGTGPDGDTGVDFFDPAGVSAASIALSAEVEASIGAIAAGTADGTGGFRGGANDIALSIAALRDAPLGALGGSAREHYQGLVSGLGQTVRSLRDAAESRGILAEQADIRRMSVSGVSVDEELVSMIEFQRAYQASARVVAAADELLQALLAI